MRQTIVIIFFLSLVNMSFGQLPFLPNDITKEKNELPDDIKKIMQYEGDYLLNVREFDPLKNLVFSHYKQYVSENWNGKYITMITGNIYNDEGQPLKAYHLHSNSGLSIWYYEYDSAGNNTKVSIRNNDYEDHDSLVNKNPYHYISNIENSKDLVSHPKILEIDSVAEKYLLWDKAYDRHGNLIAELSFNQQGDTSSFQRYEYDENNNAIYFYNQWSKVNHWECFFEYEDKISFFEDESISDRNSANLIQSVRVNYDDRAKRKRISNITFYKYDTKNRLIEELEYDKGVFQANYVYEYNENNQVTRRLSYVYEPDQLVEEKRFEYNKEGNVIKEINYDYRTEEKETKSYSYKYEYYK